MLRLRHATLTLGAIGLGQLLGSTPARADMLHLERWATNQGSFLSPSTFLTGDFDGNGKTDLAYVFVSNPDCLTLNPEVSAICIGFDFHLSCDNKKVACPAGVRPGAESTVTSPGGVSGAFVMQHTNPSGFIAWRDSLQECSDVVNVGGCDVITGKQLKWLSGDFDGNGLTDIAFVAAVSGGINIWVYPNTSNDGTGTPFLSVANWATNQGGWIDPSQLVVGDFNGDGMDDIAYVFDDNNSISIDVHQSTGSGFQLSRWSTRDGGWAGGTFLASDFNGDGFTDIGYAFEDNGGIDLDVRLSTVGGFHRERWGTHQGDWMNGQLLSTTGTLKRRDRVLGSSMISRYATASPPGLGMGGAGLGDILFAFNDYSGITIDSHLAHLGFVFGSSASGQFNNLRYATQQGTYPDSVLFYAGDFNGDSVGDVADAFKVNDEILVDVHAGVCSGQVDFNGNCCSAQANVCNGDCCYGTCSNSPSAVNGCCPYGQYCPPPPPPP